MEYQVGDKVLVNVGSIRKPNWIRAEVILNPLIVPHIHVKLVVHPESIKRDESYSD